ncbi:MAG: hypothetical protein ACTSO7_07850 [Candidatus Heimdallarchaeota archaeon]
MVEEKSFNSNHFYFRMRIPFVENLEMLKGKDFVIKNNYWSLRLEDLKDNKHLIVEVVKSNLKIELAKNYLLHNKRRYSVHLDDLLDVEKKFGLRSRTAVIKQLKQTIYLKLAGKKIAYYRKYVSIKEYIEHVVLPLNVFSVKEQQQILFDGDSADDKIESFVSTFERERIIKRINSPPLPAIYYLKDQFGLEGEYSKADLPLVIGKLNNSIREQVRPAYYKDPSEFEKFLPILRKRMLSKKN